MGYDWEKRAVRYFANMANKGKIIPDDMAPFRVVGIAVENLETGEGALLRVFQGFGEITDADVWNDIQGDAQDRYNEAVEAMRETFEKRRRPN